MHPYLVPSIIILDIIQTKLESETNELIHQLDRKNNEIDSIKNENATLVQNSLRLESEISRIQKEAILNQKRLEELRVESKTAVLERENMLSLIDRKNEQLQRLEDEIKAVEKMLHSNIASKCEAIAKFETSKSFSSASSINENIIQQENSLLKSQIQSLKLSIERNASELLMNRNENSVRIVALENKLAEKVEELRSITLQNHQLQKANNDFQVKIDDLAIKIRTDADANKKIIDYYERELLSQKKLADLRKENSIESEKQVDRLTGTIKELQMLLHEVTDDYGNLEAKLKDLESKYQCETQDKDALIQRLNDELENANHLFKYLKDDNFETKSSTGSNLRVTEIYSAYTKVAEELAVHKKENEKLQSQLQNIVTKLETKAPELQKQAQEYHYLVDENNQLKDKIKNLTNEFLESQRIYDDAACKISYLERYNHKLKTQNKDLSRQVSNLLQIQESERSHTFEDNNDISSDMNASEVISNKVS